MPESEVLAADACAYSLLSPEKAGIVLEATSRHYRSHHFEPKWHERPRVCKVPLLTFGLLCFSHNPANNSSLTRHSF